MIVWSGKGFLSFAVLLVSIGLLRLTMPIELSDYANAFGFFISAIFSFYFGLKWNSQDEGRVFVDEKTGERVKVKNSHTLFWIKMEYIGLIFLIIGILILFKASIWSGLISLFIVGVLIYYILSSGGKKLKKEEEHAKQIEEIFKNAIEKNESEDRQNDKETNVNKEDKKEEEDLSRYMPKTDKKE